MMPKTRTLALTLATALLAACGSNDRGGAAFDELPEEQRYGGTAVIGSISDIPDINPLTSTETLASEMQQHVLFLPVLHYNENFEPIPAFARSWEVNADTTLLTFHLRDDIFWHDGVKTTAYDLAFAYEKARDPATGFPNTAFWTHYGRGEAIDSFTFQVALTPHAEFLDPWRTFPAAPVQHPRTRRERAVPFRQPRRWPELDVRGEPRLPRGTRRAAVPGPARIPLDLRADDAAHRAAHRADRLLYGAEQRTGAVHPERPQRPARQLHGPVVRDHRLEPASRAVR
jgi:hypothetical protein